MNELDMREQKANEDRALVARVEQAESALAAERARAERAEAMVAKLEAVAEAARVMIDAEGCDCGAYGCACFATAKADTNRALAALDGGE